MRTARRRHRLHRGEAFHAWHLLHRQPRRLPQCRRPCLQVAVQAGERRVVGRVELLVVSRVLAPCRGEPPLDLRHLRLEIDHLAALGLELRLALPRMLLEQLALGGRALRKDDLHLALRLRRGRFELGLPCALRRLPRRRRRALVAHVLLVPSLLLPLSAYPLLLLLALLGQPHLLRLLAAGDIDTGIEDTSRERRGGAGWMWGAAKGAERQGPYRSISWLSAHVEHWKKDRCVFCLARSHPRASIEDMKSLDGSTRHMPAGEQSKQ